MLRINNLVLALITSFLLPAKTLGNADDKAFWRMECFGTLAIARLDSLMFPGEPSSHVHNLKGASGARHLQPSIQERLGADRRY